MIIVYYNTKFENITTVMIFILIVIAINIMNKLIIKVVAKVTLTAILVK